jgi:single-strand DNA-binding protein
MSLNKAMLIGNVGRDPDVKYVEQGVPLASFPLATTERGYTLQNGTQVPERTEWHNIVAWRRPAEYVEKFIHKGDRVFIEGQLRTRNYEDRNGITRYVTEIWAERVELLSSRPNQQPTQGPEGEVMK